jgi:hypothetical protein
MKTHLNLHQNLDDFESFYDMLGESHEDLDREQSEMLNAQLVLLLANHVGNIAVLREAFALARVNVENALPRMPSEG